MPSKDEGDNKAVLAALVLTLPFIKLSIDSYNHTTLYKCARSYRTSWW